MFGGISLSGLISYLSGRRLVGSILYVAVACALIIICTFKGIGSDQDSVAYLKYFNLSDYAMTQVAEPTFILISNISRFFSADRGIVVLFFFYALIGVTIKFYAIGTLTELKWLSVLTYFSTYFLLHEFTQIRVAVASGLLLVSLRYVLERRPGQFALCVAIASLFHYSALLAAPLYFLSTSSLDSKQKFAIALAIPAGLIFYIFKFNIIYAIPIELVRSKIAIYTEVESLRSVKINVFNIVYLFKYMLLYVFLIFSGVISKNSPYFPILLKVYAISMFAYLALSFNTAFAMRISELFGVVEIILIPLLFYAIKPRIVAVVLVVAIAAANLALGVFQTELIQQAAW